METIKGYVEHIVYRNEDNGYTVFNLNNEDGDLTCVGKFHYIEEGELLELTGEFIVHKMYGTQLQVDSAKLCEPEDLMSIERYLGSGAVKGVGAALAGRTPAGSSRRNRRGWRRSRGSASERPGRSPFRWKRRKKCARP